MKNSLRFYFIPLILTLLICQLINGNNELQKCDLEEIFHHEEHFRTVSALIITEHMMIKANDQQSPLMLIETDNHHTEHQDTVQDRESSQNYGGVDKLPDSGMQDSEIIKQKPGERTRPNPNEGICQPHGDFPLGQPFVGTSLQIRRNYFLSLTNQIRERNRVKALSRDSQLDKIAQQHSADMKASNFFDHENKQGQQPQDRAHRHGFYCPVGQNIVFSWSITLGSEDLRRSMSHFPNIIDEQYDRVGLGIVDDFQHGRCTVYLTQLFAVPCDPEEERKYWHVPERVSISQLQTVRNHPAEVNIFTFEQNLTKHITEGNAYACLYNEQLSKCLRQWLTNAQDSYIYAYIYQACQLPVENVKIVGIIDGYLRDNIVEDLASDRQFTGSNDASYNTIAIAGYLPSESTFTAIFAYDKL